MVARRSSSFRRGRGRTLALFVVGALTATLAVVVPAQVAQAAPCDVPIVNPVLCENTKTGNPASEWDVSGAGSANIQGFATDISVDNGQTVRFKVDTNATAYRLDIYRMGYYGGSGARRITTLTPSAALPQNQPNCLSQSSTGLVDCGNWAESASWATPADAVSGIYFAHLVRTDGTAGESHIFFVVRDDQRNSDVLFQTSDTTWQAYNDYGGNNLYNGAVKVSYNRPFTTRDGTSEDWVFNAEYPTVRFLERNGYDVSYTTGIDTARFGSLIRNHKVFLSVGHDEYWSGEQRANVEAARDAGVHLAFMSGNEVFWKTRWEPSISTGSAAFRTLVTYKETHANEPTDPQDPPTWTGTWRDPRFSPPADGGRPENALTGQLFLANCCKDSTISVPGSYRTLRFWRNTRVASLAANGSTQLSDGMLDYEWDSDVFNSVRPAGLMRMSSTTVTGQPALQDYGSTYGSQTLTHNLTLYRAPSGALVFGAGTVQWAWGLDGNHDRGSNSPDAAVQQATVNLLADMGVQPGSLMTGLVAAAQTTDSTAPTSTITSPAAGATVPLTSDTTISGTATDAGGGVVSAVEVSVDGGVSWKPATGTTSWTYTWRPATSGTYTIKSRAVDDSGRLETASAGVQVTAGSGGPPPPPPPPSGSCPCTIWPSTATPAVLADPDSAAVELGVKFRASEDGTISGIRFYKAGTNTGTHLGRLWTSTGTQLANVTFSGETASGWQQANFATPVAVTAGTTYVASYYAPVGRYSVSEDYFAGSATTNGPLTALQDGTSGGNGVYRYGAGGGFPNSTWASSNYWVDVVFNPAADTVAPTVTARTPASGATDVPTNTTATATFSEPVQASTITMTMTGPSGAVAGQTSYDSAAQRVTFTPSAALTGSTTYTVNVSGAKDTAGNTMTAVSWNFTTVAPDTTAPTVTARTPAPNATNVATNTTATATFSEPVQSSTIAMTMTGPSGAVAGSVGYDAATQRATFTPTAALAEGASYTVNLSGAKDSAGNTMTAVSWSFTTVPPDTAAPTVTTRTPAAGATGVAASTTVTATFNEPVQPTTISLTVTGPSGAVAGQQTYDAATQRVTFTPSALLAASTSYTANLSGAKDVAGNTMTAVNWSFTTEAADTTAPTVTARTPAAGTTGVSTGSPVTATFSEPMQSTTVSVTVTGPSGAVGGSQSYETAAQRVTFTPTLALANSTTYTVTVSGGKDLAGNTMANDSWTFTTVAAPANGCPCSIWPATATPQTAANNDTAGVEVGVKFRAASDGFITGIKFYKGTGNSGTHVGKIWSRTGTQLGSVTFTGETATGWQQATFASPIAVTAGTTYVASYYAPAGRYAINRNYFSAATVSGPLTALANGTDGGNGVYRYGGGFPNSSFQSSNYWVDVVYTTSAADTTRPTVTTQSPAPGATAVPTSTTVSTTFSESVQQSTITFQLTAPNGSAVPASMSYDGGTRTATLSPSGALNASTTYTATVSGAADAAGNVMTPVTWTFTTAATSGSLCPCTIWPGTATPATPSEADGSAVNLGVKFRADRSGYITGIRFYKGSGNTGTHVGRLWTSGGQSLGSVTFTGETASGWQQATFAAPIPVTAGTTYVASYHAPSGGYAVNQDYFTTSTVNGPLTALADGTDGGNGVYDYGAEGFPSSTYSSSNYWVDVVFDTTANDTSKPTVTQRTPAADASGVPVSTTVRATFSEAVTPGSVLMTLTGPGGAAVAGSSAWDAASQTMTFTPSSPLGYSTTYQASASGGTDNSGNVMDPVSWSFTTAAEPPPPPDQGPGGPIAIVTTSGNPFSSYLAEIVRTEGFNEFRTVALGNVTATTLAAYDVVVLGETALTDAQATTFSNWVTAGGNLIAMRPDARLASLLGLTRVSGTVAEGYLKVDATTSPGAGITTDTMQYHGTSDRYTLNGASAVAALYSNATTATGNPAVTLRSVGTNGGQAAAFTYDLARSTVYLRQGNPAWAGQERDNDPDRVIRTDDMFFGGSSPDWVNLSKVSIPQADEQQRLLANLIEVMNTDRKPLPRFWYFPNSRKAVVVATGDDHANGGTSGRFNTYAASSPSGCSVSDWQCLRFTSYIYPNTPLSNSAASTYNQQGFELGLHPNNGCSNFTPTSLQNTYTEGLGSWRAKYTSVPSPVSNRFHCLVYSDWASQPKTELANGIRFDVNYYYWPGSWVQDRPGFMTGSGIPMRFADTDGTMIDVYQSNTVMTDESGQSYPFTPDTLLDNALGAKGYYGAFTANMHTDNASTFDDDQLVASATSRGVAVVSARQMLTWLDGRNASSFGNMAWSNNTLSFSVSVGAGANGLTGMLPTAGPNGANLSTLTRGGSSVTFTRTTIKGVEYAMFAATAGSYQAVYTVPQGAPIVTGLTTEPSTDGSAQLTFTTNEPATTELAVGTSPSDLQPVDTSGGTTTQHTATVEGLEPGTRYFFRVTSTDARGRSTTWPSAKDDPAVFRTPKADRRGPVASRPDVLALPDGTARVSWSTGEPADSRVLFGTRPDRLRQLRLDDADVTDHEVVLTGLRPDRTYYYRVVTRDEAGNRTVLPARGKRPLSFVSSSPGVAVHTAEQLRTGRLSGTAIVDEAFGSLTLAQGRTSGTYRSPVLDARAFVPWDRATWDADLPAGTRLSVAVRSGSTAKPGRSWSEWQPVAGPGGRVLVQDSRFLQYRVELVGSRGAAPTLTAIGFTHAGPPPAREGEHE